MVVAADAVASDPAAAAALVIVDMACGREHVVAKGKIGLLAVTHKGRRRRAACHRITGWSAMI